MTENIEQEVNDNRERIVDLEKSYDEISSIARFAKNSIEMNDATLKNNSKIIEDIIKSRGVSGKFCSFISRSFSSLSKFSKKLLKYSFIASKYAVVLLALYVVSLKYFVHP